MADRRRPRDGHNGKDYMYPIVKRTYLLQLMRPAQMSPIATIIWLPLFLNEPVFYTSACCHRFQTGCIWRRETKGCRPVLFREAQPIPDTCASDHKFACRLILMYANKRWISLIQTGRRSVWGTSVLLLKATLIACLKRFGDTSLTVTSHHTSKSDKPKRFEASI